MRLSLAAKISIAIIGVLVLAATSSLVSIGSAYRFERMQQALIEENLEGLRAAEELEIALLFQRGYVSSYMLDSGNQQWLDQLQRHYRDFDYWMQRARATARTPREQEILDRVESFRRKYVEKRQEVVTLFDDGQESEARQLLLQGVTALFDQTYAACEEFISVNQALAYSTSDRVRRQVEQITVVITVMLLITLVLSMALLWLFFRGVIGPLRRIAADARTAAGDPCRVVEGSLADELRELGHYVQLLMTNVKETRSDLEVSRLQLAHADKLAAVGKLAAGVAHEIRNPLTSIKMWLYSLRRGVGQDNETRHKFDIVADEITRLESIVHNFLEFSRPQQLNLQPQNAVRLVDKAIELVRHRLEDQKISLERVDEPGLPLVQADTDQMKQVILNLLNNAIEAMPLGGVLRAACSRLWRGGREMVAVHVSDTGSGISDDARPRIFQPFFTTKEEGTGLGLCIAASTMARHDGLLELESTSPSGTHWVVWIPAVEN